MNRIRVSGLFSCAVAHDPNPAQRLIAEIQKKSIRCVALRINSLRLFLRAVTKPVPTAHHLERHRAIYGFPS